MGKFSHVVNPAKGPTKNWGMPLKGARDQAPSLPRKKIQTRRGRGLAFSPPLRLDTGCCPVTPSRRRRSKTASMPPARSMSPGEPRFDRWGVVGGERFGGEGGGVKGERLWAGGGGRCLGGGKGGGDISPTCIWCEWAVRLLKLFVGEVLGPPVERLE